MSKYTRPPPHPIHIEQQSGLRALSGYAGLSAATNIAAATVESRRPALSAEFRHISNSKEFQMQYLGLVPPNNPTSFAERPRL
jgi:hypothetical protein